MDWIPQDVIRVAPSGLRVDREAQAWSTLLALRRRAWLIILLAVLGAAAAGVALAVLDRTYMAEALIQVDFGREQPASVAQSAAGVQIDPSALVEDEARLIRSRAVARGVIERLALDKDAAFAPRETFLSRLTAPFATEQESSNRARADAIAVALLKGLTVKNDTRSYLIAVSYSSTDPDRSARLANAFAEEYLRARIDASIEAAERTRDWLAMQVRDARDAAARAEDAISAFHTQNGLLEASPQGGGVDQGQLRDAMVQRGDATLARIAEESRLKRAHEAIAAGFAPSVPDQAEAGMMQRLVEAQAAAKAAVNDARIAYGARHPNVERATAALAEAQMRLDVETKRILAGIETGVAAARATEATLTQQVDRLQGSLIRTTLLEAKLRSLQADASALRERAQTLTESFERARALSELRTTTAKVVLPAQATTVPSGPNPPMIIAGGILGAIGCGVVSALLLERRDTGFRSASELADGGVRCLGSLPEIAPRAPPVEKALFSESVRQIAATAGLLGPPASPQVVMVTSVEPREGKSVLMVALARCLADAGQRVLAIDASPAAAGETLADEKATLERLLEGERSLPEAPEPASRVRVVRRASGLGGGQELFGGAFDGLIQKARRHYDAILVEAPPISLVADALILGRSADAVVLAVRWRKTRRAAVAECLERLTQSSVDVVGVVLSRVNDHEGRRGHDAKGRSIYFRRHADPVSLS
ncbi:GumC family protein [Hansschlegelia zhihuaiae]|nr:polysaccharide biosynthesis tyrosine autokinase [Hansschlegelia zhihuaiae]